MVSDSLPSNLQECGMSFAGFEDFRTDDVIECYVVDKAKVKEKEKAAK